MKYAALALALAFAPCFVLACSTPETHPAVLGDCKDPKKCDPTPSDGSVILTDSGTKDATTQDAATQDAATQDAATQDAASDAATTDASSDAPQG